MENFNKLSILIPVYNESVIIHLVLDRIKEVALVNNIQKELILVNDCSTDDTEEAIQKYILNNPQLDIHYFKHAKNFGKGACIHTAIPKASGDYCIIQDADLEYDPQDYSLLIQPILLDSADIVYGSRFLGQNTNRNFPFWHYIANRCLTSLTNLFSGLNLTDVHTCYKLIKTSMLQQVPLKEKRFAIDPELTAKISRIPGIRICEIGISYNGRTHAEGKKITWKDGISAIYAILKYNLFSK